MKTNGQDGHDVGPAAVDVAATPPRAISRRRLVLVDVLIAVTTLLLVVAIFSVWANRLLFNPENWSTTSTQLLANPEIRSTTANYLVDQVYANTDIPGLVRSELPPALKGLAAPATGALRNVAVQGVELALARPRVQSLWAKANYAADQTFIAVVNGGKGPVNVEQGAVTLDLAAVVDNVASRVGLPADISAKLPPHIANLTIFTSNHLKVVQNGGKLIRGLALWLTILVPLLYALAIVLAGGHRRRTLMSVGLAIVLGGVIALLGRSLLESQIPASLTNDATLRPTVAATVAIGTAMISEVAGACIFVGLILTAAAWFAGPNKAFVSARHAMAPFLREQVAATYGITLAVMALIFIWDPIPATGKPAGMIVFTALALLGVEVLRRQTAREFPEAPAGAATAAIRARWEDRRARRSGSNKPLPTRTPASAGDLQALADLHATGELSEEEYRAAKALLLER